MNILFRIANSSNWWQKNVLNLSANFSPMAIPLVSETDLYLTSVVNLDELVRNHSIHSEERFTILHCQFTARASNNNGGWIYMTPKSYIFETAYSEWLQVINILFVPVEPEKYYFSEPGQVKKFTMIFPAIPKNWKTFNFLEDCDHGFFLFTIPTNNSGIYYLNFV